MAIKGGYTILDLGGYNFTAGTAHKIDGAHGTIINSYDKPILLSGIQVGSAGMNDMFVQPARNASLGYDFTIPGYKVTVAINDNVTFAASAPLNAPTAPTTNGTYVLTGTKNSSGFTYAWASAT